MSSTFQPETPESTAALLSHIEKLNAKLRENNVTNGFGESWLNQNIPDWKSSVGGRVVVSDTRFGYPKVYPRFRTAQPSFGSRQSINKD